MKKVEDLHTQGDIHTGETNYFIDKELSSPYTGWIIEEIQGNIIWQFHVENGKQNGTEKVYYPNGKLEQICEYNNNLQFGVSKEYSDDNKLTSVSIIWNNSYLKTLHIENDKITKIEIDKKIETLKLPEKIQYLLTLSNENLINYKID